MDILEAVGTVGIVVWTILGILILAALVYSLPTVRRARDVLDRVERVLETTETRMDPIFHHLRRSVEDADHITSAVRADVGKVSDAVEEASRSARRMVRLAEERAAEISGFLEVVQEEAEHTFVSTATVLRAIRGAARRARGGGGERSA